ncbi:hypothetical protein GGX14DRAFT_401063 [Mycena pura]|uniref:Uncharacterized protein n=1 Tax=Mycena pura TaxID=153505 RepID=A0AAD6V3I1_9AGAR|nr:hypothetical protein GGX14DRAFT_401063 [Mycena pura]
MPGGIGLSCLLGNALIRSALCQRHGCNFIKKYALAFHVMLEVTRARVERASPNCLKDRCKCGSPAIQPVPASSEPRSPTRRPPPLAPTAAKGPSAATAAAPRDGEQALHTDPGSRDGEKVPRHRRD